MDPPPLPSTNFCHCDSLIIHLFFLQAIVVDVGFEEKAFRKSLLSRGDRGKLILCLG